MTIQKIFLGHLQQSGTKFQQINSKCKVMHGLSKDNTNTLLEKRENWLDDYNQAIEAQIENEVTKDFTLLCIHKKVFISWEVCKTLSKGTIQSTLFSAPTLGL